MLDYSVEGIERNGLWARISRLRKECAQLTEQFFKPNLKYENCGTNMCPACGKPNPLPHEKPHYRAINSRSTIGVYDCSGVWVQTQDTLERILKDARIRKSGVCTREHKQRSHWEDNGMWG